MGAGTGAGAGAGVGAGAGAGLAVKMTTLAADEASMLGVNGVMVAAQSVNALPPGLSINHVISASPGVVVVTNSLGLVLYVNPAFTRLLGYTPE